jgi:hypothetical protein
MGCEASILEQMPCDIVVVYHHDPKTIIQETLQRWQFLLLKLITLDGLERDSPMAALGNPGV